MQQQEQHSSFHSFHISPGAGINDNPLTIADKNRHLQFEAGGNLGSFCCTAHRITFYCRLSMNNLQFNKFGSVIPIGLLLKYSTSTVIFSVRYDLASPACSAVISICSYVWLFIK